MKNAKYMHETLATLIPGMTLLWMSLLTGAACQQPAADPEFKTQFLKLCDLACEELNKDITPFQEAHRSTPDPKTHHVPFFEDSYAVRALCVAYDMTGKAGYLKTCQHWADRVVALQSQMIPSGAYYMNYLREPGKDQGDWCVADSGSIGMGVLATASRTPKGEDKDRYLDSIKAFAKLVMTRYAGKEGGITDGLWSGYGGEWWCSTATFGSLMFLLHKETGDAAYLDTATRALDWMTRHDLRKAEHISFEESAPGVVLYCGEFYAAALEVLGKKMLEHKEAVAQIEVALQWMTENQKGRGATTHWNYLNEATYMSGLPLLMYVFARALPDHQGLVPEADRELRYVADLLFKDGSPPVTQLTTWELMSWAMLSYAERLNPGSVFRNTTSVVPN